MNYDLPKGISFYQAVAEVQDLLKYEGHTKYTLTFNDTSVQIHVDSHINDICTIYQLKRDLEQKRR